MERIGIFVGSFDPFTVGHDSIVRRALPLFDRLVIGVGYNEHKHYDVPTEERVQTIRDYYREEPRIDVMAYSDLTVDFAARVRARYIIKGVRSVKDFEYEREQADINRQLTGLETILLFAEPQYASISSSLVRELQHFGQDVRKFLMPTNINP